MKKLLLSISIFMLTTKFVNAQCSTAVTGTSTNNTFAKVTGQSFKATCSAKLNSISFSKISPVSDDLRSTGYKIGIRIKNSANQILADGFWANGSTQTDVWYPNLTNVVADFQCADLSLVSGQTYTWEVYCIPASGPAVELILFGTAVGTTYADGTYIADGVAQATDALTWSVNLTTTVTALTATQSQTNPGSSSATNGSASVTVSGGVASTTTSYVWKKNGTVITGQTGSSISNLGVGTYTVDITKGCSITKSFTLTAANLGTIESSKSKTLLYPNPATTEINVNLVEDQNITIYSADGKLVKTIAAKKGDGKVNINKLPAGNYLLKSNGETSKFIKK